MTAKLTRLEHNYEGLASDFQALNCAKQDEALINAFNAVPNCLPATKDVYRFVTPMTIDKVDGTGKTMVGNRYLGPRIHDALNVAICGHTRNEISVGLNFRKVNVSDHDTPEQELWKAALKSRLRNQILAKQLRKEPVDAQVVLDLNQKNLRGVHELLPEVQEDGIVTEKMTVACLTTETSVTAQNS